MFESFIAEVSSTEMTTGTAAFRLVLSLVLGSLVGIERKRKGQIAGIRTFALICMGATLAMILSIYVPQEYLGLKNGDPGRIAAQVISGIGFLGAGAIIQMKGSVRGLTTAAGIWMVATIGLTVGVGLYMVSVIATALILFILLLLEYLERLIHVGAESRIIRIKVKGIVDNIESYRKCLAKDHVALVNVYVEYDFENPTTSLNLVVLTRDNTDFVKLFSSLRHLNDTKSVTLSTQVSI